MDDYDVYDGNADHDMWVDFLYEVGTGEDVTGSGHADGIIGNAPYPASVAAPPRSIDKSVSDLEFKISCLNDEILFIGHELEDIRSRLKNPGISPRKSRLLSDREQRLEKEIAEIKEDVERLLKDLAPLKRGQKTRRFYFALGIAIVAALIICLIAWLL